MMRETRNFNKRTKGEAYFLRALVFWEGVYRYGGLPIIVERINPGEFAEFPRNTFAECVDRILKDCDMAAELLPDFYTDPTKLGRATRIAALALKSRVLLYAASPLFNTNTPYLPFPGHETLIGYGNYDNERWKAAADAAKEAIDAALFSGHYDLVRDQGVDKNYEYVWTVPDNKEIIFANKKYRNFKVTARPLVANLPSWANNNWWTESGLYPTLNFVKFYETKEGEKAAWSDNGGDNLLEIYNSLDPRFDQTIVAHGSKWNDDVGILNFLNGGAIMSPSTRQNIYSENGCREA